MAKATNRFQGQKAVVTGGVSGIGWAIVERLASEGAAISVWDRAKPSKTPAGAAAFDSVSLELTEAGAVEAAAKRTIEALGGIDILVCSAGVAGLNALVWDYPLEEWRRVIDINLNALFYCNRAVVPHMREKNYGRIVNIASIAGKEGNPTASAYSASKAGVIGFTKSLGKELAKTNITVNAITPAAVRTPIFDQVSQEHIDFMLSKIPMGRFGKVEEIASIVCWLASEECSFTTGSVFDVSGGRATY
jgi:NAD(P)-dependent dehydrogenase (short-subunit alcohol dehydrogenase family)